MSNEEDNSKEFLRDYEPIPEHLLHEWINRLKSCEKGNSAHGIAKFMIEDFCMAVRLGESPPRQTLEWIAGILRDILKNGKPDSRRAFSLLPNKQGNPGLVQKHLDIAAWVSITISRGYKASEAVKKAASVFSKDEKTIRNNWNEWNQGEGWNFQDSEEAEKQFKEIKSPLPPRRKSNK